MKRIVNKINETGTLLVEAMAMLGLIAMVTPVLYKKASERTLELQDVNASSQLRALSVAVDSYLRDNFAKITKGETIGGISYEDLNAQSGRVGPISITNFADYLPYGFLDAGGNARETKIFENNYSVYITSDVDIENIENPDDPDNPETKVRSQILTGFVVATPKNPEEIGQTRASRIASMIGSNGGYVQTQGENKVAMGTQGIWSVPITELDAAADFADNTFVISSIQPISSQGLANEDVLHRKDEPDVDQELNTMETDLFMGFGKASTRNIRLVNQIIMHPDPARMVGGSNATSHGEGENPDGMAPMNGVSLGEKDTALYIGNEGGAYMEGALRAANSLFEATSAGIKFFGSGEVPEAEGSEVMVTARNAEPTFSVDAAKLVYGNPGNGNAKFNVEVNNQDINGPLLSFGTSEIKAEDGTVTQSAHTILYATNKKFAAGDENLVVNNDNGKWYAVIGKTSSTDAEGNATTDATPHSGTRTTYSWIPKEGGTGTIPDEGATAEDTYEASINGSLFVKDTLLTAKSKTYNVDAAALRAGMDVQDFEDNDDMDQNYFLVARKNDYDNGSEVKKIGFVTVGNDDIPMMTISEEDREDTSGRSIYKGITLSTMRAGDLEAGKAGIGIIAGNAFFPYYADQNNGYKLRESENREFLSPQDGAVKIAAESGIYLSTYADVDHDISHLPPVSIQGDMFTVYRKNSPYGDDYAFYNPYTIDSYVDDFNIISRHAAGGDSERDVYDFQGIVGDPNQAYTYFRPGYDRRQYGRVNIVGSSFIIADASGNPIVDVMPEIGDDSDDKPTTRIAGGLAIYDSNYDGMLAGPDDVTGTMNPEGSGDKPTGSEAAFLVRKGAIEVRTTAATTASDAEESKDIIKREKILVIDNNKDIDNVPDTEAAHGTVYIRKGGISLASNHTRLTNASIAAMYAGNTDDSTGVANGNEKNMVGYIAADRFISNFASTSAQKIYGEPGDVIGAASTTNTIGGGTKGLTAYDHFEVNPAYTSVMHDIKLTTRGGARLSDILPDFINKGIYLVTNTFKPEFVWSPEATLQDEPGDTSKDLDVNGGTGDSEVSAYNGFVPTPKCPPGYAKVITLTPASWVMAQAGTPYRENGNGQLDIREHYNPNKYLEEIIPEVTPDNPNPISSTMTASDFPPLMYQKNTWFKSMVLPHCGGRFKYERDSDCDGGSFHGWGAIMGFVYPQSLYNSITGTNTDTGTNQTKNVYWNLYPVRFRQIEGYATVYCYFDRKYERYDPEYVDVSYDQLKDAEGGSANSTTKGPSSCSGDDAARCNNAEAYIKRLDDPALRYYSPW